MPRPLTKLLKLIFSILLVCSSSSFASHFMAGDLTYKHMGGNTYEFTLSYYRDCEGIDAPYDPSITIQSRNCGYSSSLELHLNAGYPVEVSQICGAQLSNTSCNGGPLQGAQEYKYSATFTLPSSCNDWNFSYSECCRNGAITNLNFLDDLYLEVNLDNSVTSTNSSPYFTNVPTPYICANQPFTYSHGVVDPDGDSLVYQIINSQSGPGAYVGFRPGYSLAAPIQSSSFVFDPATGSFTVVPSGTQVSMVAMEISEYRNGVKIGSIVRELQVVVLTCSNNLPYLDNGEMKNVVGGIVIDSNSVEICPGQSISFTVVGIDPDAAQTVSMLTNLASAMPGATFTVSGTNPATGSFSWTPSAADEGLRSFSVTLEDNACPIFGTQTYTFDIRVLTGTSAGPDLFYCPAGGPLTLNAVGGTTFTWTLLPGNTAPVGLSCSNCASPQATPTVSSVYEVVSDLTVSGCSNRDTVSITVVPDFSLTGSPDVSYCDLNSGVQISVTPSPGAASDYTYSWTPSASLSSATIQNPMAKPRSKTNFVATVTSAFGCKMRDTIEVDTKNLVELKMSPYDGFKTCNRVNLNAYLDPVGFVFYEPFDNEIDSTSWESLSGGSFDAQCGSQQNKAYYFNQGTTREIVTKPIDLTKGAAISFYLKTGNCKNCLCDYPENDDQNENLVLEYSIDGGTTWVIAQSFDSDYYSSIATSTNQFTLIQLNLPTAALTATTQLRWYQEHFNVPGKDVWILDELQIKTGLGPHSFEWSPPVITSDPFIQNPIGYPISDTLFTVIVTDLETGCIIKDTVRIDFDSLLRVIPSGPRNYCLSNPNIGAQLSATPLLTGTYTYAWSPAASLNDSTLSNPIAMPSDTTTYLVEVRGTGPTGPTGCVGRASVKVNVIPDFQVNAIEDTVACDSSPLQLNCAPSFSPIALYSWAPAQGLNNAFVKNPIATITGNMEYFVTAYTPEGCFKRDSVEITVYPDYDLTVTNDTIRCQYDDPIVMSAQTTPSAGFTYEWTPSVDPNNPVQTVNPVVTTTYYVLTHQNGGCYKNDSVTVYVGKPFNITTTADTSLCENNSLVISTTPDIVDPYIYSWTPTAGLLTPSDSSTSVTLSADRKYYVTVTDTLGCFKLDSVNIVVYPDFTMFVTPDTTLCPGVSDITLSASVSTAGNFDYLWTPSTDATNPDQVVNPAVTTDYTILVHQQNGCYKRDTVTVTKYNSTFNFAGGYDTTIYEGERVQLSVSGASNYYWTSLPNGMDNTFHTYSLSPVSSTQYMAIGYDACYRDTAIFNINVILVNFFIPNLITPNGDRKNDSFHIANFGEFFNLQLYNRWGDLIHKEENYLDGWNADGFSDGVYYYEITDKRDDKVYKGWLQVTR